MDSEQIRQRVQEYFVDGDNNCAMTALKLLSEVFDTPVDPEVVHAANCMPGAGGVGGLCGLVSGVLMFIGVWGGRRGLHRRVLAPVSKGFTEAVQQRFGSDCCRDLKPADGNGCAKLAEEMLEFAIGYLTEQLGTLEKAVE